MDINIYACYFGTKIATGEYIEYLDANDPLAENKISKQFNQLYNSEYDVAYGNWQSSSESEQRKLEYKKIIKRKLINPEIDLFTNFWCPPAVYLIKRKVEEKVGSWNENLPIIQDARFVLDCALTGSKFVYINNIMAYYRKNKDSLPTGNTNAFINDCFYNTQDIENIWKTKNEIIDEQIFALINSYEYIARASYSHGNPLFSKAYNKLFEYGFKTKMLKNRITKKLYYLIKLVGYKNALYINYFYNKIKF